jgi:putative sporulation protein YyaC
MEYSFHIYNKLAADGTAMAIDKLLRLNAEQKYLKSKGAGLRSSIHTAYSPKACTHLNTNTIYTTMGLEDSLKQNADNKEKSPFNTQPPVIVCIGSDLAIGDSLGPITGSMLKYKTQGLNVFLYGTLAAPITAKEIGYIRTFLKETHKNSQVIAIDAAVGAEGDIGLIKINDKPLLPGAGANKKLGALGDISLMGVVAEKSLSNYGLFNTTRLNLVYSMAEIISEGLANLLWERTSSSRKKGA